MFMLKPAIFALTSSSIGLLLFTFCLRSFINRDLVYRLFFVLAACIFVSFASPNIIINIIVSFFIVPIFAKNSSQIAPVYIFYFLNVPGIYYQLHLGSIYLFDWYNYSSLTLGALLFSIFKSKRAKSKFDFSSITIMSLVIIYFVIGFRGTSATNAVRVSVDLICTILLPFMLIRKSIRSISDVNSFFVGIASATASLSGLAIYEARVGWPIYTALSAHYSSSIGGGNSIKLRGGLLRSAGPFPEPTSFALWLAIGTFVVIVSRWMFKSRFHQTMAIVFCFYGLSSPQSRGAILGLFCAFVFYKLFSSSIGKAIQGLIIGIFGIAALYVAGLMIPSIGSMLNMNSTGAVSRDYRQDLFSRGMQEAYKHPVIGQSAPDVMASLSDLKQGEGIVDFVNTYLYILLTTGFFGATIFVSCLMANLFILISRVKYSRKFGSDIVAIGSAIIFSISMMLIFTSLVGRTTAGLSMFIALGGYLTSLKKSDFLGLRSGVGKRHSKLMAVSLRDYDIGRINKLSTTHGDLQVP